MNEPLPQIREPATYQDAMDAPENLVAELVDGSLHHQAKPPYRHGLAGSALVMEISGGRSILGEAIRVVGGFPIDESELHVAYDVVVPDVSCWRKDQMPEALYGIGVDLAPDWVCEVLSPRTRILDLTGKSST